MVAIFALALVPTVSRWLATPGGSAWAEVCTPQGPKSLAASTDEQPTQTAALHLDHCALCGLAGQALAPPTVAAPVWPQPLVQSLTPSLHAPRPQFTWAAAQARAPPFGHA